MYYVYRFLDKAKNIIYVGKSKQELEQRFRGHLHLPNECYDLVYRIEYIECKTESDMSIKEIYYINKYKNSEHYYFNVLDMTELPISVDFDDKWKKYKGPLGENFKNSINYKKGYTTEKEIKYNKDGSIDKRKTNKEKGTSSYVDAFSDEEVNLIINYLIQKMNEEQTEIHRQVKFRNLLMFVLGINLPLRTNEFLCLKYKDLFNENDEIKPIELKLGRFRKDITIYVPLKEVSKQLLLAYKQKYELTFEKNANDDLFESRKRQPISSRGWWNVLNDLSMETGINKNIGSESIRKTYGLNIYNKADDKLNALLFLGELWGNFREAQIINYLNLTNEEINFDYYFGEHFSLGNVDLSKIKCLQKSTNNPIMREPFDRNSFKSQFFIKETNSAITNANSNDNRDELIIKTKSEAKPKSETQKLGKWSKEIKIEIVEKNLIQHIPQKVLAEEYGVSINNISRWSSLYQSYGEAAFDNKKQKS